MSAPPIPKRPAAVPAVPIPQRAAVSAAPTYMAGQAPIRVSASERVPVMSSKSGMFTGPSFSSAGASAAPVRMASQRVQALPKTSSFGSSKTDKFVPSAAGPSPVMGMQAARAVPQRGGPFSGGGTGNNFSPTGTSGAMAGKGIPMRGAAGPKLAHRPRWGQGGVMGQNYGPGGPPAGSGGKKTISYDEAKALLEELEIALAPITEAEAAQEDHDCLREMKSGPFPVVARLAERLRNFVQAPWDLTQKPGPMFEISHGELTVTQKALDCASSIGRAKTIKTVATVAGVGAGAAALLLLL